MKALAPSERAAPRLFAGCVAGLAVGAAASWLRFGWERTLRLDTGTGPFLVSALVLGLGLAVASFCALRLERLEGPVAPEQLRWAIVLQLVAAPALALTSLDLFSNVAYGQMQLAGRSPYLEGPRAIGSGTLLSLVSPRWVDTPSAYGPVSSLVSRGAALVGRVTGSPLWGGGAGFKLAMLLCAIATVLIAWALLRREAPPDAASRFALVAFAPILAWEISAQAHNDGLLVVSLMAFVWAARRGRTALAVVALTVGVLSKLPAAPLLVLYLAYLVRTSWRRAVALGAVGALVAAILFAPYWHGVATFQGSSAAVAGDVERHAHSLADLLALVLRPLSASAATVSYWACWIASVAVCALLFVRGLRRATTVDEVIHHGLVVILGYCLTAPWFQPWYATWLLPLAVAERNAALRRVVALYAALSVVQWAVPLDPFSTVAVDAWIAMLAWRAIRGQRSSQDGWTRSGAAPVT